MSALKARVAKLEKEHARTSPSLQRTHLLAANDELDQERQIAAMVDAGEASRDDFFIFLVPGKPRWAPSTCMEA